MHLFQLLRKFSPSVLILMETRVPSTHIQYILAHSNFSNFVVSKARGFAGGIWVLWDSLRIHLDVLTVDDQVVNLVARQGIGPPWLMSAIYTSPKPTF